MDREFKVSPGDIVRPFLEHLSRTNLEYSLWALRGMAMRWNRNSACGAELGFLPQYQKNPTQVKKERPFLGPILC